MDWTQALSQFASGYANADLRRRQLAEQKRQREATAKAQGERWQRDYVLKLAEIDAKGKADATDRRAKTATEKRTSFENLLNNATTRLSGIYGKATDNVDPVSAKFYNDQAIQTWNAIKPSLEYQYNDPDVRGFYDPKGVMTFDQFASGRMGIPVVTGTTGATAPPIPVDIGKMAETVRGLVSKGTEDMLTAQDPSHWRNVMAPYIQRLIQSGRTEQEAIDAIPELKFGKMMPVETTELLPQEGASWSPETGIFPGMRPTFGHDARYGDVGYRVGLPENLRGGTPQNFIESVASALGKPQKMPAVGGVTSKDIVREFEIADRNTQQRAAGVLSDPAFMRSIGIQDVSGYADPEVRRRAIGGMFGALPRYAKSDVAEKFAASLERGPIESVKLSPQKVVQNRLQMPQIPAKTQDEARKTKLEIEGTETNNAIKALELDLSTRTFDSKVAQEHAKAILQWWNYNLAADKNEWQKDTAYKALGIRAQTLNATIRKQNFDANKMLMTEMPRLLNDFVKTSNYSLETAGKALGSSLNQTVISALFSSPRFAGKLEQDRVKRIAKELTDTGGIANSDDKDFWEKDVKPSLSAIPGGRNYVDAQVKYDNAYKRLQKYQGIQDTYTQYLRSTVATADPFSVVDAPESLFPGVDEENNWDIPIGDEEAATEKPVVEPTAPSPARPKPAAPTRGALYSQRMGQQGGLGLPDTTKPQAAKKPTGQAAAKTSGKSGQPKGSNPPKPAGINIDDLWNR